MGLAPKGLTAIHSSKEEREIHSGAFRSLSNIYDGGFLERWLLITYFRKAHHLRYLIGSWIRRLCDTETLKYQADSYLHIPNR